MCHYGVKIPLGEAVVLVSHLSCLTLSPSEAVEVARGDFLLLGAVGDRTTGATEPVPQ